MTYVPANQLGLAFVYNTSASFGCVYGVPARLTVSRGEIALERRLNARRCLFFGGAPARIVQRGRSVTLIHTWLAPPWTNNELLLQDADEYALVLITPFAKAKVLSELHAAGIEVERVNIWWFALLPAPFHRRYPMRHGFLS